MGDVKQILVVDDHFEMLEFLRSMLQVSNKDHQVLAVPSAEEALLELRLTNFDLLISDVRLPGMSGFDLVRRARRLRPDIPVVMITAYSTEQGRAEADELGILRYFEKPLDTDGVLTVVHRALYGEQEPTPLAPVAAVTEVQVNLTDDMERRLDGLRADTGAFGLLLVAGGHVVYESGGHRGLHPDRIATIVNQKMGHSSMLAEELGGGDTAFNLLYQSGERYEIYTVNIGRSYFVTLLFEASARRGRIGTVWVFVQRAVKDLAQILPKLELGKVKEPPPAKPAPQQAEMATPPPVEIPRPEEIPPQPLPPPLPEPEPEPAPELEPTVLSEEEMAEFVGLFEGLETADTATDLDAFWDSALDEGDAAMPTRGISFEDAVKQGLLSSDFETKE
jgi:CheY-like chemotaxis protein/predicted regulator of Ras-like GTPase activity (Roadblock/LC7/MglB family)